MKYEYKNDNIKFGLFISIWSVLLLLCPVIIQHVSDFQEREAASHRHVFYDMHDLIESNVDSNQVSESTLPETTSDYNIDRTDDIIIPDAILNTIGDYTDAISAYSSEVMSRLRLHSAYVYDCCEDPDYGGYSIHIMFDSIRYQCIWINPDNRNCLLIYDCKLTNPVYSRLFN